ncbi:MAG: cytosolic long-chain acyl-CoA thioester hydrolase family protein [Bacteroidetes bacterium]|nr:cytosolic long-chain acyl-CoA thioester hydrolase family protein [Bacteroidota bacterium]
MINKTITYKMIKSEDLNHHGTLFAGRCAEWFVEASFIAAGSVLDPKHTVCLKVHGLEFVHPMKIGSILGFESRIVHTGRTSVTVYTCVHEIKSMDIQRLDGFVTFCYLNEESKPTPHGLVVTTETEEEIMLNQKASELLKRRN